MNNPFTDYLSTLLILPFGCFQRIQHQHGAGHGANAAGHRGDVTGLLAGLGKIDVPVQLAVSAAVDAHVDDDSAGLDHIAGDKALAAHGGHQNIGGGADLFQVLGLGVADGDGGVLGQQQQRGGLAHDVGAADDHGIFTGDLGAGGLDHADAACRGAGQIAGLADLHAAHVDGRETVHILLRRDGVDDGLLVDLLRQGQLDQDTVYGRGRRPASSPRPAGSPAWYRRAD